MTIVGTDGKEKYIVEGETVTDAVTNCELYLRDGYHLIGARGIDSEVWCVGCNQTLAAIRIKGEQVV